MGIDDGFDSRGGQSGRENLVDVVTSTAFLVVAEADPLVLAWVVWAMARARVMPDRLIGMTSDRDEHYFLTIEVVDLERTAREDLIERLSAIDGIHDVRVIEKPPWPLGGAG